MTPFGSVTVRRANLLIVFPKLRSVVKTPLIWWPKPSFTDKLSTGLTPSANDVLVGLKTASNDPPVVDVAPLARLDEHGGGRAAKRSMMECNTRSRCSQWCGCCRQGDAVVVGWEWWVMYGLWDVAPGAGG